MTIKFSEDQKLYAIKLYQEGKSITEVEQFTSISASYIKNLLKKYNISARPSGFQIGNLSRTGKPHSKKTKNIISEKHKSSGHKPSLDAIAKGQPLTLKAKWKNHIKDPIGQFIKIYKRGAIKRSLEFSLTREEFESLINTACYYCGSRPTLRNINGCNLICNGIDREDNNKGYYKENCLPCCKICNVMKWAMSHDDFIRHCYKISGRFKNVN